MITRIWRGWTTHENANTYHALLLDELIPSITARNIAGYRGISLLRRELETETEFTSIMWFDSLDRVRDFAGEQYEKAIVPLKARALLSRYDQVSAHYDTLIPPPTSPDPAPEKK